MCFSRAKPIVVWLESTLQYYGILLDFGNCFWKEKWGQVKGNRKKLFCYRALHKLSKYLYKDYLLLHQLSSCLPR